MAKEKETYRHADVTEEEKKASQAQPQIIQTEDKAVDVQPTITYQEKGADGSTKAVTQQGQGVSVKVQPTATQAPEKKPLEKKEDVFGYDQQLKALAEQARRYSAENETDEERERRKRAEAASRKWNAIGDGIRSISNLVATMNYAPNGYVHEKDSTYDKEKARQEKAKAQRDANRAAWLNNVLKMGDVINAKDAAERAKAKQEHDQKVADAQLAIQLEEAKRRAELYPSEKTKKEYDALKAQYDAMIAGAKAGNAGEYEAARLETEKQRGKTEQARQRKEDASAASARARAAAAGSKATGFTPLDAKGQPMRDKNGNLIVVYSEGEAARYPGARSYKVSLDQTNTDTHETSRTYGAGGTSHKDTKTRTGSRVAGGGFNPEVFLLQKGDDSKVPLQ